MTMGEGVMRVARRGGVVALALALALLAGRAQPARAGNQMAPSSGATSGIDWGVNQNGWQVVVHNQSSYRLVALNSLVTDNVKYSSGNIPPRADGFVNGKASVFGGPANMNFQYDPGGDSPDFVSVDISSDNSGHVDIICAGCRVDKRDRTQPIEVSYINR
jgi:hypothetical protein